MNSGSYVDPKFLTGEDYSQGSNGMVGSGGGVPGSGYMSQSQAPINYYHPAQHSAQYPGAYPAVSSQSGSSLSSYSREAVEGYNSYYHHGGMLPHMQMAAAQHLSSPLMGNDNILNSQHPPPMASPVSSQPRNRSSNSSPVSNDTTNQMVGYGPLSQDAPPGGEDGGRGGMDEDGMSSDCSGDESENGGQVPIVYQWMKPVKGKIRNTIIIIY